MPTSRLVTERYGIIAWWETADRDHARLAVLIDILVRPFMEPTGHGAAPLTGPAIPIRSALATPGAGAIDAVITERPFYLRDYAQRVAAPAGQTLLQSTMLLRPYRP
jgi:hypothetical protein